MTDYSKEFYQHQMQGSLRSAQVVVPLVIELTNPHSVIDVGCGVGTWLSVYQEHGVSEILGLDGEYVERQALLIDEGYFQPHNLTRPLGIDRKFDLVQSLEVAEHIEEKWSEQFINELTSLGDMVLFSAAVPYQLGTGHVNERYIDYWMTLFRQHNYHPVDAIRPAIWDNEIVEICYRQNIMLFVQQDRIPGNEKLQAAYRNTNQHQLSIIHPDLYQPRIQRLLGNLQELAKTVQSNGNLPLALHIVRSILDFDPRNSSAWDINGQLAAQSGDMKMAVSHLLRAIALDPSNASHYYNLGQVYAACEQPDDARREFTRALEFRPGDNSIQQAIDQLGK